MKYWETEGDFMIQEDGYATEKCVITSYVWCLKTQKVNLLDYFSADYLNTAPEIKVNFLVDLYSTDSIKSRSVKLIKVAMIVYVIIYLSIISVTTILVNM